MIATVVLRVRAEALTSGEIVGWIESIATGERYRVRSAWELVEVLRELAGDAGQGREESTTRPAPPPITDR